MPRMTPPVGPRMRMIRTIRMIPMIRTIRMVRMHRAFWIRTVGRMTRSVWILRLHPRLTRRRAPTSAADSDAAGVLRIESSSEDERDEAVGSDFALTSAHGSDESGVLGIGSASERNVHELGVMGARVGGGEERRAAAGVEGGEERRAAAAAAAPSLFAVQMRHSSVVRAWNVRNGQRTRGRPFLIRCRLVGRISILCSVCCWGHWFRVQGRFQRRRQLTTGAGVGEKVRGESNKQTVLDDAKRRESPRGSSLIRIGGMASARFRLSVGGVRWRGDAAGEDAGETEKLRGCRLHVKWREKIAASATGRAHRQPLRNGGAQHKMLRNDAPY